MRKLIYMLSLTLLVFVLRPAFASTLSCNYSDVYLTTLQLSSNVPTPVIDLTTAPSPYAPTGRSATDCVGLLLGNDMPKPDRNIGEAGDGLLNGEDQQGGHTDPLLDPNTLFSPGAFVGAADLQDLDGDGVFTDPGWVMLGRTNGESGTLGFDYEGVLGDSDFISDVLNIEIICLDDEGCTRGTWKITPDFDIIAQIGDVFGKGYFDHLAFVFKSGNVDNGLESKSSSGDNGGGQFSVYDFNFNTIKDELGGAIDLKQPYILSGTFDLGNTFDGKDISHVSVWARDPIDQGVTISEPSNLILFVLAITLLFARKLCLGNKLL